MHDVTEVDLETGRVVSVRLGTLMKMDNSSLQTGYRAAKSGRLKVSEDPDTGHLSVSNIEALRWLHRKKPYVPDFQNKKAIEKMQYARAFKHSKSA